MSGSLRVVERSRVWFGISLALALIALVSLVVRGLNFGIDFTGGMIMTLRFEKPVSVAAVREAFAAAGLTEAVIREAGGSGRDFVITARSIPESERTAIFKRLQDRLGRFETLSLDHVTPVVGAELRRAALLGVVLATLGMLVYISVRFEWRFGVSAIVALVHDVFLTIGFFSVFQLPVDSSFVAAILTIYGYSIMDTIIVFDRIRENLAARRKESLPELVDRSLNQVLVRSINTSLMTLAAIGAVLVFGGPTVRVLSLALVVGILFGTYSSIFLASPLYVAIVQGRRALPRPAAARK